MSCHITIRFYEELNDFLPAIQYKKDIAHNSPENNSIKDIIESFGIPHTEVDLILVNGESVTFDYLVQNGDRISVYPVFEALDISGATHLQPHPLRISRFILDTHLGRLASYLRMTGFDTLYQNNHDDLTLAEISANEQRILLTRDRQLLMRKIITRGYYVRQTRPRAQLQEVIKHFDLYNSIKPFSRCIHCNGELHTVDKKTIEAELLPRTRHYYQDFWKCDNCGKIYWKGSHYYRMCELINSLRREQ